jgi:hypothetical protein
MKFLRDEKAVSEVVGALMILLIIVLYIGTLQAYEVPKWNKEIESQHFDTVYSDFVNLRSNFEDVSAKNIPKTASLSMGVKYPERFMLRNPGSGTSGILNTYPLRINLSYNTTLGPKWTNYTSMGLIYEQNGISDTPKLVYENGLLIKDYDNGHSFIMEDKQSLTTDDNIFVPVINGDISSVSTMEKETFNIQPISREEFQQVKFTSMDVTIETRYPDIWKNLSKESRPAGSQFTIENGIKCPYKNSSCLKITNIPGYNIKKVNLPGNRTQFFQDQINMGMVSFDTSLLSSRGPTGPVGQDISEKNQGRFDIPSHLSQFIIRDIQFPDSEDKDARLKFSVKDTQNNVWSIEIKITGLKSDPPEPTILDIIQKEPGKKHNVIKNLGGLNGMTLAEMGNQIDLTSYYNDANIGIPNALNIDKIDNQFMYVNFLIN